MQIEKKDIFQNSIWGDAFLHSITGIDFSKEDNRLSKLDEICREQRNFIRCNSGSGVNLYVADIGFDIRKDSTGGGGVLTSESMAIM